MQEDSRKFEEWLTTIVNTRLIYNSMEEMESVMDNHSIHSNGIKRCLKSPQKMRAAYHDLKVEVSLMTDDYIGLDILLQQYRTAWEFYRSNLARRSNPADVALELLRYIYLPQRMENVARKKCEIYEMAIQQGISIPFLLLLLLKIIPGYDSKGGDVENISQDFMTVLSLLEQFTDGETIFSELPVITKARNEQHKSRLMLLYHVTNILDTYEAFFDSGNIYSTSTEMKQNLIDFDIEGYWNECDGKLKFSDFWKIENTLDGGCYFATHWHKDSDNNLTGIRYTLFMLESADGRLIAYIVHPKAIMHRIKGLDYADSDHCWYITDMPSVLNPETMPFKRVLPSKSWNMQMNLTRITESSVSECYDNWFRTMKTVKPFENYEYELRPGLYAITQTHLYILSENKGEYYKVPRDINEGIQKLKFGDNVGIMQMDNKTYLAFDELLLYIDTTKSSLKKYGIERVGQIE